MKLNQVKDALIEAARNMITLCLIGPSGIGKSEVVQQVAAELDYELVDWRLAYCDLTDMKGLPVVQSQKDGTKTVQWVPPAEFFAGPKPKLFFWDEVTHASPSVMSSLYQVICENAIGGHQLPDDCVHVVAHNRISDKGIHNRVPNPLRRRWCEVNLEPDINSWCQWAFQSNSVSALTIACLRNNPDMLYRDMSNEQKAPDPRSWVKVDRMTANNTLSPEVWFELVSGLVGEGDAVQYKAYRELFSKLPSIDAIRLNPKTEPVPDKRDTALLYAVSAAIAKHMDAGSIDQFYEYCRRLPAEYVVMAVKDAYTRDNSIKKTRAFVKFATEYQGIV